MLYYFRTILNMCKDLCKFERELVYARRHHANGRVARSKYAGLKRSALPLALCIP
jgi:hypothetical protein